MQKFQGGAGRPVLCPVYDASTPRPGCPLRATAGLGGPGTARSLEAWDIPGHPGTMLLAAVSHVSQFG